jgi:hypothetical protein
MNLNASDNEHLARKKNSFNFYVEEMKKKSSSNAPRKRKM